MFAGFNIVRLFLKNANIIINFEKQEKYFSKGKLIILILQQILNNMKRINKLIFSVFALFFISCASEINVRHVDSLSGIPENDGLYYTLPKTVITVEVTVNKTFRVKGPYSSYAKKYLGFTSVINENSSSYSLDNVKINSYAIPDPEQQYYIEIPKGNSSKNSIALQLCESGIITGINDSRKPKTFFQPDSALVPVQKEFSEPATQYFINRNLDETFDTLFERVTLDTITIVKKILKKVVNEKTAEQKAKEASDFIMHIKESRYNLLNGYAEVNYSRESIEYMNDNLSRMEKEYLELFTGITVTRQLKYFFTYTPSNTLGIINAPLFRLTAKDGVADTTTNPAENVILRIERINTTKPIAAYEKARLNPEKKSHGFYYRIPEYAKVSLIQNKKVKTETNIIINQFGAVCELPASGKIEAAFYPNSGSLKAVVVKKKKGHWLFEKH